MISIHTPLALFSGALPRSVRRGRRLAVLTTFAVSTILLSSPSVGVADLLSPDGVFDLGMPFELCDVDATASGWTVFLLKSGSGPEIWTLDPSETEVEPACTYSLPGSVDCHLGLRDLFCPDDGTVCYAAGSHPEGGDEDTWVVGCDWEARAPGGILPGKNVTIDLTPGGPDRANSVAVYPTEGQPEEIHTGGTDGDFGATTTIVPGQPVNWNFVQISGQKTEVVATHVEDEFRWTAGRTIPPPGEAHIFVCREKRTAKGWVVDGAFGKNGCWKMVVDEAYVYLYLDQFTVIDGRPMLIIQEIDTGEVVGLSAKLLSADGTMVLKDRQLLDDEEIYGAEGGSVQLVHHGGIIFSLIFDRYPDDEKPQRVVKGFFFREAFGDLPFYYKKTYDLDQESLHFFADFLSGSAGSSITHDDATDSRKGASGTTLPPYDTLVFLERDGSGPSAGLVVSRVEAPSLDCFADGDTACLLGGKFKVEGEMTDFSKPPQEFDTTVMTFPEGRAESDQAVFFESFNEGNFEVGVKMVNACGLKEGHPLRAFWAFFGGLTNAETRITVRDTVTLDEYEWSNPSGVFPQTLGDTGAFPCLNGAPQEACARDDETACLLGGRFQVTGSMKNFADPPEEFPTRVMSFPGDGRAESSQAVFFQSFTPGNFEAGVKMVNACGLPLSHPLRHYWVFYGALTNAETRIRVTQRSTGLVDEWLNPARTYPASEGRTKIFPCE